MAEADGIGAEESLSHIRAAREHMRTGKYSLAEVEYFNAGAGPNNAYKIEAKMSLLMLHTFTTLSDAADKADAKQQREIEEAQAEAEVVGPASGSETTAARLQLDARMASAHGSVERREQKLYESIMKELWGRLAGLVDEMQPMIF